MNEPDWHKPGRLEVRDGNLYVGGVKADDLARTWGTPVFVFIERILRDNAQSVINAFRGGPCRVRPFYASKANSNLALLQIIRRTGFGVEVNSTGELYKALRAGFDPKQIIYNGVAKTGAELRAALDGGVHCINVDSVSELVQLMGIAQAESTQCAIVLRVSPNVVLHAENSLNTATASSKFAMNEEELKQAVELAGSGASRVRLLGLHMHLGAQVTDAELYRQGIRSLFQRAVGLRREKRLNVSVLNIGGGLPVRFAKASDVDAQGAAAATVLCPPEARLFGNTLGADDLASVVFEEYSRAFVDIGAGAVIDAPTTPVVYIEPGTKIVAESGVLIASVVRRKVRSGAGSDWLLLDAGCSVLPDALAYRWFYHLEATTTSPGVTMGEFRVAGPLCDGGDVFFDSEGQNRLPPCKALPESIAEGDNVAFFDVGAYSLEQMSQYNGRIRPGAVLVREDCSVVQIRSPDGVDDLIRHDILLD
jgi:D-ornithine/D-lysine decarboxylase